MGQATTQNVSVANIAPNVLIVFDRSGSMNEDLTGMSCAGGCGPTSKWSIATAVVASFLPTTETSVNWGLKLFASNNSNACSVSNGVEVVPGPANAAAVAAALAKTTPGSSTPTTAALMNAAAYLTTVTDPGPKFILLVTDGVPNCGTATCALGVNVGTGSETTCDDANAINMVKAVHAMGIPVFVLGIGTASSPGDLTLSEMALNGGYPRNASPAYYPVDGAESLTTTLTTVTKFATCLFVVTPTPTAAGDIASVSAGGVPIANDPQNGWSFAATTNGAGIALNGSSCEAYKNGTISSVTVQLSCRDKP